MKNAGIPIVPGSNGLLQYYIYNPNNEFLDISLRLECGKWIPMKFCVVEATKIAAHARELVKDNNFEVVVHVIEASMEDITLPEKGLLWAREVIVKGGRWRIGDGHNVS
ncbi:hypothetical protein ACFE04_015747 [Oxalis oulophora]